MPFGDPSTTPYDLHFRLFGFPVRIHPFFWVVSLLLTPRRQLGDGAFVTDPRDVLLWTGAVLVSIVVHELGHTFFQRRYGGDPYIVLYSFGGLAYDNGADLNPRRQILVSLAGPFAGFALAAVLAAGVGASGHRVVLSWWGIAHAPYGAEVLDDLLYYLFQINVWWGVLNLLPIYPLDGGRVAREVFGFFMPFDRGIVASLWLSIVVAGGVAAYALVTSGSLFRVMMFWLLAYNNYQTLEAYRFSRGGDRW